ncbi:hypothetical protein QJS04_geneDACA021428 [Acorus gramineus]|uniref:Uncharacterized protein n=1 Tax=Acorus gramineus TaxID=55184 RepID=A0AAV9A6M5_ACOGR|nr:hypothetical protein QJS04_geneDACA021428 [Acorus gramineus]
MVSKRGELTSYDWKDLTPSRGNIQGCLTRPSPFKSDGRRSSPDLQDQSGLDDGDDRFDNNLSNIQDTDGLTQIQPTLNPLTRARRRKDL